MASVVKDEEAKSQDDDRETSDEREKSIEHRRQAETSKVDGEQGFFHIYKPGQGYWTRMGTAGGALLIAALCLNFMYRELPAWIRPFFDNSDKITDVAAKSAAGVYASMMAGRVTLAICGVFLAGFALLVYWLMNKPSNADFLIATDSEMKKVNWTSKKELWGSTKIVIIFMFLIATMLFSFDIIFGYIFYFIGVLKTPPF
jgi:preprotein translocase SecE subunit